MGNVLGDTVFSYLSLDAGNNAECTGLKCNCTRLICAIRVQHWCRVKHASRLFHSSGEGSDPFLSVLQEVSVVYKQVCLLFLDSATSDVLMCTYSPVLRNKAVLVLPLFEALPSVCHELLHA